MMKSVSTTGSILSTRRAAVTSRILTFSLSQMDLDDGFRTRHAEIARSAPFDLYDIAMAAERIIRRHAPDTYRAHEEEWLRRWTNLHTAQDAGASARFWLRRVDLPTIRAKIESLRPFRQRYCRRYLVSYERMHGWRIIDLGNPAFTQMVDDRRARVRNFPSLPDEHIQDPGLLKFMATACELVSRVPRGRHGIYQVTAHWMLTHADEKGRAPAPEGMHQDGADYIISGVVLERQNVRGGASVIVLGGKNGPPIIDSIELHAGQGILQADLGSGLFHGVSSIHVHETGRPAFRSILGLDVEFVKKTRNQK